ncbi:MAG: nucleotidyltransferase family protein [Oscillospiraceae bacterium]|nr:nucleotidyltransferase family protein [Oscillospiraceae bacterium]
MDTQSVLFRLLRLAVCGEAANDQLKMACTPDMLDAVYTLASRHDLAHLVGQAASKLDLPESEALTKCKQTAMQALMRYMRLSYEYEQTCQTLEQAQIPFIPLKGSVLREDYPEPWMRTSCDVDVLVKEEQLDAAVQVLTRTLGYTAGERGDHDIVLRSAGGIHLELHYDTIQERYDETGSRKVLARIWQDAQPKETGSCHHVMSDAMFYFYHMAHMAKHFQTGGCGIRTFLDVWILDRKAHDAAARQALLAEGGLAKFAQGARKVAEYWFSGEAPDGMTRAVSDYILRSGIYGDNANRAAVGQAKRGGRMKYLLTRRVFMPYDFLKAEYPILKKHKWLTPVYQVVRWIRMLIDGRLRYTVAELKANAATTNTDTAGDIIKHLGL